ncbi:class I SAM-dependent methyltransferase [Pseudomonas cedrina]|uniref:class I SAM-dependent methyltransferase n=1 Tax=Pseudomonas cedrina TaxID=651740 RepID=UPI00277E2803|nr:class I SAM-dependent methyltransferase [Pseudomonas cedrina]MDQ0654905.1 hypothetical protein [Pseudomonas cedrina]
MIPHILDVGVGRARDASEFIQAGHRVTGLDIVENSSWPLLRNRWGEIEPRELNIGFFSRIERKRPWVRIKLAMSLDGARP